MAFKLVSILTWSVNLFIHPSSLKKDLLSDYYVPGTISVHVYFILSICCEHTHTHTHTGTHTHCDLPAMKLFQNISLKYADTAQANYPNERRKEVCVWKSSFLFSPLLLSPLSSPITQAPNLRAGGRFTHTALLNLDGARVKAGFIL